MTDYASFLASKDTVAPVVGLADATVDSLHLFPFQRDLVRWALRRGRSALFADTGLGKTRMQLNWAAIIARSTGGKVLILAPLAVASQTVREGAAIGVEVTYARSQAGANGAITIANYEMLQHFDPREFVGVVLDESSCLKDYTSSTRNQIIESFAATPYRLACTATPSPNDFTELGNHAEFLGIMKRVEMLSQFFTHDGGSTQDWTLKGHAKEAFWRWVCSWACLVKRPSDLGYDDAGYDLPALHMHEHVVKATADQARAQGLLFAQSAVGLTEQRQARKASLSDRVLLAASIVAAEPDESWVVWCELNDESDALAASIQGAVEVRGADSPEHKVGAIEWFVGRKCLCVSTFGSKLAGCETPNTSANTTSATERSASQSRSSTHDSTQKNEPHTSLNTTPRTRASTSALQSSNESSTSRDERSTQPTQITERSSRPRRRGGKTQTLARGSIIASESTASPPTTTSGCYEINSESARSVDAQSQPGSPASDSTSTTATQPGESAGSCALAATKRSESSATTQLASSGRQCTCGVESGRRVLISKPSIFGYGLNLQNCARVVFVGISHSFEQFYQAVRRNWRFGQTRDVHSHIITSEIEGSVLTNLRRKEADAAKLAEEMRRYTAAIVSENIRGADRETDAYEPQMRMSIPTWLTPKASGTALTVGKIKTGKKKSKEATA